MTDKCQAVPKVTICLIVLGLGQGCTEQRPTPSEPKGFPPPVNGIASRFSTSRPQTYDDHLVELNDSVPGFGGLYYDSTGTPHVYLMQHGNRERAVTQVGRYFEARGARGKGAALAATVQFRDAKYEFHQLSQWHRLLKSAGVPAGVTMLDVDDLANRLAIGVDGEHSVVAVQEWLMNVGIPSDAAAIMVVVRPRLLTTLQQPYAPRMAGLQISTRSQSPPDSACTLGFLSYDVGTGAAHVVTNSHCTNARWSASGDWIGHPYETDTIGNEVVDPPLFSNLQNPECPQFRPGTSVQARCRYSDAAVFLASFRPRGHGKIALTNGSDLTIQGAWTITSTMIVGVGTTVRKVGRTTGTSVGIVRHICADAWHSTEGGNDVVLLCQGAADFASDAGDSGAPVFADDFWSTGYGYDNPVMLQGILWGNALVGTSYPYSLSPYTWYSLTPYIQDEIQPYLGSYLDPVVGIF